jgi:transcriptional regulator with XRE-family HTH domain
MTRGHSADPDSQRLELARRLREAREYVGLSQDEVAAALGLSRPAITNIESGTRKVEAIELERLSGLYGRSVESLLSGETSSVGERVAFLARATQGLSDKDLDELARFAAFLRSGPKSKREGRS